MPLNKSNKAISQEFIEKWNKEFEGTIWKIYPCPPEPPFCPLPNLHITIRPPIYLNERLMWWRQQPDGDWKLELLTDESGRMALGYGENVVGWGRDELDEFWGGYDID